MNRKYLTLAIITFGIIAIAIIFLFHSALPKDYASISPLQLLSFASHHQVRATICDKANSPFLKQVCEKKFDLVAKDDMAKIDELFLALNQAQKDKNLSHYEKFLLGQLIFATLPNGVSPDALRGEMLPWVADIAHVFGVNVYAQNAAISREQYEAHLVSDLASIIKNCPKAGDENWILTAMCSEYAWIDGERQPIYSKKYTEAGGPNWCNEQGEAGAINMTNTQSIINTKMRNEYSFSDSPNLSNDIGCMFSCVSFPSAQATGAVPSQRCEPDAKFKDYTEAGYSGDDLLKKILDKARNTQMPSPVDIVQTWIEIDYGGFNLDKALLDDKECAELSKTVNLVNSGGQGTCAAPGLLYTSESIKMDMAPAFTIHRTKRDAQKRLMELKLEDVFSDDPIGWNITDINVGYGGKMIFTDGIQKLEEPRHVSLQNLLEPEPEPLFYLTYSHPRLLMFAFGRCFATFQGYSHYDRQDQGAAPFENKLKELAQQLIVGVRNVCELEGENLPE
jgi:hypothetical protein